MPSLYIKTTVRLPRDLSARLTKHVTQKKRTVRKYSKNEAVIEAVQTLLAFDQFTYQNHLTPGSKELMDAFANREGGCSKTGQGPQ